MAVTPRRSQFRVAYAASFAVQSGFGSAIANGSITQVFNLDDTEPKLSFVLGKDRILDCSGNWLVDEVLQSRSCLLSFGIEIDLTTLAGLLKWFFGTASGSSRLLLALNQFQPSATTFIVGYDDAAGNQLKLTDMVGDEITVTGVKNGRIRCNVSFRGHGAPTAPVAYTFPACTRPTPIRLSDGDVTIGGTGRLDDISQITFRHSNRLLFNEDPFPADDPDIDRMERADEREGRFTYTMWAQPGDADSDAGIAGTHTDIAWQIGTGTGAVTIQAEEAVLRFVDNTHAGEARRASINFEAEPVYQDGDANTPYRAVIT